MVTKEQALEPFVLSIDVGSSSVRTVVLDRLVRVIVGTEQRKSVSVDTDPDGTAVMHPESVKTAVFEGIDGSLLALADHASKIQGVGMCTYVSNLIAAAPSGKALTPVITYADSRSAADTETLRNDLDEVSAHQRTGCRFHTSYWTSQLSWLARTQPELFQPDTRWWMIGDYLYQELFGETGTSYSAASWTGLLNRFDFSWDEDLLEYLRIEPHQLPEPVDSNHAFRGLKAKYASRWPELSQIPWYPAVGDGATANIGSACTIPSRVALTMGTTAAIRVMLPGKVDQVPAGLWSYKVDGDHELLGGAMSEGGNIYAWLNNVLRIDETELAQRISNYQPDQHGLIFLPLLAGERAPGWVGSARGTVHGLSLATDPVDILISGLEGVAYRIGMVYQMLEPHLDDDTTVVANGGALVNSPEWLQIIADVLGRPVMLSGAAEASSLGAGMIALKNIGVVDDYDDFEFTSGKIFDPRIERYEIYQKAVQRQQELYQRVVNTHE